MVRWNLERRKPGCTATSELFGWVSKVELPETLANGSPNRISRRVRQSSSLAGSQAARQIERQKTQANPESQTGRVRGTSFCCKAFGESVEPSNCTACVLLMHVLASWHLANCPQSRDAHTFEFDR